MTTSSLLKCWVRSTTFSTLLIQGPFMNWLENPGSPSRVPNRKTRYPVLPSIKRCTRLPTTARTGVCFCMPCPLDRNCKSPATIRKFSMSAERPGRFHWWRQAVNRSNRHPPTPLVSSSCKSAGTEAQPGSRRPGHLTNPAFRTGLSAPMDMSMPRQL